MQPMSACLVNCLKRLHKEVAWISRALVISCDLFAF